MDGDGPTRIAVSPPVTITESEVDEMVSRLEERSTTRLPRWKRAAHCALKKKVNFARRVARKTLRSV
jgi:hypothetical protein